MSARGSRGSGPRARSRDSRQCRGQLGHVVAVALREHILTTMTIREQHEHVTTICGRCDCGPFGGNRDVQSSKSKPDCRTELDDEHHRDDEIERLRHTTPRHPHLQDAAAPQQGVRGDERDRQHDKPESFDRVSHKAGDDDERCHERPVIRAKQPAPDEGEDEAHPRRQRDDSPARPDVDVLGRVERHDDVEGEQRRDTSSRRESAEAPTAPASATMRPQRPS